MNNFFRALIAGYGAKKLGGGCFGTIIVFILIWVALGQCSFSSRNTPSPQSYPAKKFTVGIPMPERVNYNIKQQIIGDILVSFNRTEDYHLSDAVSVTPPGYG